MQSRIKLVENMQFVGTADSGHAVVMDAPSSVGGTNAGSKPSELLLMALGGCSGMDVISILRKKKQDVTGFEIKVGGEPGEGHPKGFTEMHIEYIITGRNIDEEAVKRAIELSLQKYCLVGLTLGKGVKITDSYRIVREA
ncbi:MAG: OsmC family protein [Nitrospira sp.]|nr:OsmC family protein [bacterium]MBL7050348.1 OsmC family protein [Nitrospira sp.]